MSHSRTLCLATLFTVAFLCVSAIAAPVTGVVTNRTNNKPSAGDDVVLLQLAQGMEELARTKTDGRGRFSIEVPADGLHLLRVTHDKANYFKPIEPGTQSVDIDVYSAAPAVEGVTLDADVMRLETDPGGSSLKVVEHFFIKNASSPAQTLMSEHPFELYLPGGATVEGLAAKSPNGMAVQQALVPESEANKYTILFPIRPGETEFQVTYKLPYTPSQGLEFSPRPTMPTDALVLMLPKSMTFKPGQGTPYSSIDEEPGAQTYAARNAQPSQPLSFSVSGSGQLPRDTAPGAQAANPSGDTSQAASSGTVDPNTDTRPGGGLGVPVDKDAQRDPWTKYRWVILIALGIAFAGAAAFMMKSPSSSAAANSGGPSPVLQLLRDEMFSLETEKLTGKISAAEYAELKSAYDLVLKRAMTRNAVAEVANLSQE